MIGSHLCNDEDSYGELVSNIVTPAPGAAYQPGDHVVVRITPTGFVKYLREYIGKVNYSYTTPIVPGEIHYSIQPVFPIKGMILTIMDNQMVWEGDIKPLDNTMIPGILAQ